MVVAQASNGKNLVVIVEEFGLCGRIGHPKEHCPGNSDGDEAEEEEDDLING